MRSPHRRLATALVAGFALTVALAAGALGLEWTAPQRVTDTRPSAALRAARADGRRWPPSPRPRPPGPEARRRPVALPAVEQGRCRMDEGDDPVRVVQGRAVPGAQPRGRRGGGPGGGRVPHPRGRHLPLAAAQRGRRPHWRPRQRLHETSLQRGIGVAGAEHLRGHRGRRLDQPLERPDPAPTQHRRRPDLEPRRASWARSDLSIECEDRVLDGLVGLAASGRVVHLAWSDGKDGACLSTALRVRTSRDGGRTWSAPRTREHGSARSAGRSSARAARTC